MIDTRVPSLPPMGVASLARAVIKRKGAKFRPGEVVRTIFNAGPLDQALLKAYRDAMGFEHQTVPLTYFYLLAQRAQLASMLSPEFGFRIAGMVHVENTLTTDGRFDETQPCRVFTIVEADPPSESGAVYVNFNVELVQGMATVICLSRYLALRGEKQSSLLKAPRELHAWPELTTWRIPMDEGRRYARLSGDWNPIHLWSWSSRLMGFARPIIHGMHSVGRAAARIEAKGGQSLRSISARFRKPINIGSVARLMYDERTLDYEISSNEVSSVTGKAAFESPPGARP